jgi:carbamoyltransferase
MTYHLGLSYSHNQSACLVRDGGIVVAVQRERLTRVKNDGRARAVGNDEAARYCLAEAGIGIGDVQRTVYNVALGPPGLEEASWSPYLGPGERYPDSLLRRIPERRRDWLSHHTAHAYAGVALSGWTEAALLVVDGCGLYLPSEADGPSTRYLGADPDGGQGGLFEHASFYQLRDGILECLARCFWPPGRYGAGESYERASELVFGEGLEGCGKLMGLAPFGDAGAWPASVLECLPGEPLQWVCRPGWYVPYLHQAAAADVPFGRSGRPRYQENFAARVQEELERALLAQAGWLWEQTSSRRLIVSGGVGLNSSANARILRETPFEEVFPVPAANDAGVAIGCAYHAFHQGRLGARGSWSPPGHDYLGRAYSEDELRGALARASRTGLIVWRALAEEELLETAARGLAAGRIIGWFQGGSEFGQRALGHRSILARTDDSEMRDRLNAAVKHREPFRPFAPAVLEEHAGELFEVTGPSRYMMLVVPVAVGQRDRLAAVTHVDGTARVQTVPRGGGLFRRLLERYHRLTGLPVLVNTSFNVMGEPIVETPAEAVSCLLRTGMDALCLGSFWVGRRHLAPEEARSGVPTLPPGLRLAIELEASGPGSGVDRVRYLLGRRRGAITRASIPPPLAEQIALATLAELVTRIDGERDLGALADSLGWELDAAASHLEVLLGHGVVEWRPVPDER